MGEKIKGKRNLRKSSKHIQANRTRKKKKKKKEVKGNAVNYSLKASF